MPVESIYSHGLCEDGKTVLVLARFADSRMAAVRVELGRPISASIVEVETY